MSFVKIEAAGTDPAYPGSKLWDVTAATVTISANGRKYTKEELEHAAETLSFRPLNINHNDQFPHFRKLEYPANSTLMAGWDKQELAVKTKIRVVDQAANAQLEKKEINHVSVEQMSNEMCADSMCNSKLQYGMAYTGLALVTSDVTPGDGKTEIRKIETVPFSQLIKPETCSCGKKNETTVAQAKAAEPSEQDIDEAIAWLKKAIARHERHMNGTEPTSDASQMKMMDEMKKALAKLTSAAKNEAHENSSKQDELMIAQVKAAVTEQIEADLKAEYDLFVALSAKLALNPLDERLWQEYQSSKWSLQYKLLDLLRLEKGEALAAKFLRKDELAIMKKAAEKIGKKA